MRTWHKNVIKDSIKACIPFRQQTRLLWRKWHPYTTDPSKDEGLFGNAVRQIALLRDAGIQVAGRRVLEIGSGWHPICAAVYAAAGASEVTLTDIEHLLDPQTLRSAVNFVLSRETILKEQFGSIGLEKLKALRDGSLPDMLKQVGFTYLVPYRTTMSADKEFDLVVSCSVLEHISPGDLEAMFRDFRRVLSPNGAMIHFTDNSDHFEQRDKTISRLNFLAHDGLFWNLCCLNPQAYQNRLRHSDYMQLSERSGFKILFQYAECRQEELGVLKNLKLAPPIFRPRSR